MTSMKNGAEREDVPEMATEVPWLAIGTAGAIVVGGVVWFFWVKREWNHAATWGAIGDAVGPFAGLATALALGFAVYATMLQRQELRLQREEMRAQREEMAAQRAEAAKAAEAQRRLATALEKLTEAQEAANDLSQEQLYVQEAANRLTEIQEMAQSRILVSNLTAQIAHVEKTIAESSDPQIEKQFRGMLRNFRGELLEVEQRIDFLRKKLYVASGKGST